MDRMQTKTRQRNGMCNQNNEQGLMRKKRANTKVYQRLAYGLLKPSIININYKRNKEKSE